MFSNKFKVCVSLATDSVDKLPALISSALQKRADFVEIRFDHTIYKEMDHALDVTRRIKKYSNLYLKIERRRWII